MKISYLYKIGLALCIAYQCLSQVTSDSLVNQFEGKTIKVSDKSVIAYLGIPFAAPPVGHLRFREPQPAKSCDNTYKAVRKPPSCMQNPPFPISEWEKRDPKDISEDCLYINLWVPSVNAEAKPFATMVWIYGGGFFLGSSNMDIYDGAVLASMGNVIVVSFNYRLGAFGYANLDHEEARGNMGMLDQVMALKWVHQNIEVFGGDRDMITLFGESAGSISIGLHLISPLTRGLFKRAILQSGSNYVDQFVVKPEYNIQRGEDIWKELECAGNDLLNCVRNVNAADIAKAERKIYLKKQTLFSFSPQVDAPYLPESPFQSVDDGKFNDAEILIGETENEGSLFTALHKMESMIQDNPTISKTEAKNLLNKFYQISEEHLDRIMEEYFGNVADEDMSTIFKNLTRAFGNGAFSCPIFHLTEKLSAYGKKVYHFIFNHTQIKSDRKKWLGATHYDDVPFVFGLPFTRESEYTQEEREFSKKVIQVWTSFAKTGNPNYSGMDDEWKPFDEENPNSFYFTLGNMHLEKAKREKCEFWKNFYQYN